MSETNSDRPLRGILMILGAVFFFTLSDAMAKWLGQAMPVVQINWIRYLVFVPFAWVLVVRNSGGRVRVKQPKLQVVRGLLLAVSAVLYVFAIQIMPLAEATSVGFISPSTRRSTQIRRYSSGSISISSRRVPERLMSMAG